MSLCGSSAPPASVSATWGTVGLGPLEDGTEEHQIHAVGFCSSFACFIDEILRERGSYGEAKSGVLHFHPSMTWSNYAML